MASKGDANKYSLSDRMKDYEAVTTNASLVPRLPIYVRIDQRAGHTFTRGLVKPFDEQYTYAIQEATKHMVEKTGAVLGYCQSDEISLVYLDETKLPFETRLFKLESVFASMATSAFVLAGLKCSRLEPRIWKMPPSFDCRVMNLPDLGEAANMILWREMDSLKNSVTLAALDEFSTKQIHKKNTEDKIQMLKEAGIDYYAKYPEHLRHGSYFRRELYNKVLTADELAKIPSENLKTMPKDENGHCYVVRSHVVQFSLGMPLVEVANAPEALFASSKPVKRMVSS